MRAGATTLLDKASYWALILLSRIDGDAPGAIKRMSLAFG